MNELVFLKNKQALTTSIKVAEYFNKRHDNILQTIEREYGDLLEFKEMFRRTTYLDSYGRQQPMYLLNRDGFFMLVTGFSGKKAVEIKLAFIKQFNRMEQILLNQRNEEWRAIRQDGKRGNRSTTRIARTRLVRIRGALPSYRRVHSKEMAPAYSDYHRLGQSLSLRRTAWRTISRS